MSSDCSRQIRTNTSFMKRTKIPVNFPQLQTMARKHIFPIILFALFLLWSLGFWVFQTFFSENARFEAFTESIFCSEVSGSALNLHYSLAYPEKQGIARPYASLGTISLDRSKTTAYYQETEKKLKSFSSSKLSTTNQLTLDMLLLSFHTEATLGENYLLEEPLSPSLGIQAQLPVLLAEYAFYKNQDITDYLNLLSSIDSYFQSILAFEQAKSTAGYFMCDETLDHIQEQCRAFIQDADNNYMQEIFSEKLKTYGKLSAKDQEILLKKHAQLIRECVLPAYQKLIQGLEPLRGTGKNTGGLANFSQGQTYYQYLLQSKVGIYLPVRKLEQQLTSQLTADSAEISTLLKENPALLTILGNKTDIPDMKPEQIMEILEEKIGQDFPEIGSVSFEIRSVHKSMEEFLSPAFYLTPPMDTGSPNVIYINHGRSISNMELFTTLAHEGFPGHLYQTVFFARQKPSHIRYLMDSGGYVEGWATYVESYAYGYAAEYLNLNAATSNDAASLARLMWLNRSVNLCIYSLLDVGIHYRGWTQAQAARFLGAFGIRDVAVVSEIYRYITETPSNYLKYYVGYLNFMDLKEEQMELQGEAFDLKEFHKKLLSIGPVQFPVLRKYIETI